MKRKIRAGTFETNSSSMHSLIVENFSKKFNPHKTETSSLKKRWERQSSCKAGRIRLGNRNSGHPAEKA